MASFLNKAWSGLDFWDKEENKRQAQQAARPKPQPARAPNPDNQPGFQITNNSIARGLSRGFDQLNPVDGGRTWKQRTPTMPKLSTVHQLTHNGATNMLGDSVVKPTIRMGLAVNQGIGNLELKLAGRKTQNAEDYFNMPGTRMLQQKTGYTGTKRQIAGDTITTAANVAMPGSSKALNAGISKTSAKVVPKVIQKTTPQVVKSVAPKVIGNAVVGGTGGAVSNVGSLVSSNDPLNRQTIIKSAKDGAITGAVVGGAIPIAAPLAKAGGKATVRGAKIIDAQASGAPKRLVQDVVANRNMRQADAIRLQAREDIRVANANKLPQGHPLRRNAAAKLKEADTLQMSVPSAQRNKVQKVTDRFFTGGGLSMSRITEDNLPTSQSSQPLAMGTSTKHTPPQTAKTASISAKKQKDVQANNLGVSSAGSVDPKTNNINQGTTPLAATKTANKIDRSITKDGNVVGSDSLIQVYADFLRGFWDVSAVLIDVIPALTIKR